LYGADTYLDAAGPLGVGGEGHQLLAFSGEGEDAVHGAWIQTHLGRATVGLRTDSQNALLQWCRNGRGVAVLPHVVGNMYANLRLIEMPTPLLEQTIWVACHNDMALAPYLLTLFDVGHSTPAMQKE
jgi:DNA-binding transcriptional LysR family regulator